MTFLVYFVEQTALGLYILLAVGAVFLLRSWLNARRDYRETHFELERDLAKYRQANAATTLILLLECVLFIVGIQRVVAPTLRATSDTTITLDQVVSDGDFNTPTPFAAVNTEIDASGVQLGEDDPSLRVLATPTLTPTPVGTIRPNSPPIIGCDTPDALLQVPANGMVVLEPINVIGVATTTDFAYYRFELSGPSTGGSFAPLRDYSQSAEALSELGQFVPSFYIPGEYLFRIAVFDLNNTVKATCAVTIYIEEPVATPTPLAP